MTNEKKQKLLSRGVRKHIRQEKARIRREFSDLARRSELIGELYTRFGISYESTKVTTKNTKIK